MKRNLEIKKKKPFEFSNKVNESALTHDGIPKVLQAMQTADAAIVDGR